MIVNRWPAAHAPTKVQAEMIFNSLGLEPYEESYQPETEVDWHRHVFTETRMVLEGEMVVNVAGNQLLLRQGDRIEIPANTRHSTKTNADSCVCICARSAP